MQVAPPGRGHKILYSSPMSLEVVLLKRRYGSAGQRVGQRVRSTYSEGSERALYRQPLHLSELVSL